MSDEYSCAIVCGGDFGEWEIGFLQHLRQKIYLIAVDHGMDYLCEAGIRPDVCIGDFDSVSEKSADILNTWQKSGEVEVIRLNPVKDDTDTEAALHLALERTQGRIVILGGIGGLRSDHFLSNVHILFQAAAVHREAFLVNASNRIRVILKGITLSQNDQYGRYVSLFPLSGEVSGLTLEGFLYPLTKAVLKMGSSLGCSNEIIAGEGEISFVSGELIIVEST